MSIKSLGAGALAGISSAAAISQLLFVGRGLNFQLTTDQALTRSFAGTTYTVSSIIARQRTGGASVACVGGLYDAASKGGNILASAATSWVALATGVIVTVPLANLLQTALLTNTPFLSLTTGSTAACTGDVFVYGNILD